MHNPFQHTALPQTTTLFAAQGHDPTDDLSTLSSTNFMDGNILPSANFADS